MTLDFWPNVCGFFEDYCPKVPGYSQQRHPVCRGVEPHVHTGASNHPTELEGLANLSSLALSGNSLTGCIPSGLWDTTSHDLAQLGLQYSTTGVEVAPVGLSVSLAADSFSL